MSAFDPQADIAGLNQHPPTVGLFPIARWSISSIPMGNWPGTFTDERKGLSDLTWQGAATVSYDINRKMSLGVGWRYFKVNYDHGDFLYDIRQSGPLITFRTVL